MRRPTSTADAIEATPPDTASLTGNKLDMISAKYDITPDEYDDFFPAYVAALEEGFTDLVVDNPKLIAIFDDIYTDAVTEVHCTQITMSLHKTELEAHSDPVYNTDPGDSGY